MPHVNLRDILYHIFLSSIIIFFLSINTGIASNYTTVLAAFLLTLLGIFLYWMFFLKFNHLGLSPILILLLLIPYHYFYAPLTGMEPWICLGLVLACTMIFNAILKNEGSRSIPGPGIFVILSLAYALYFSFISVLRHLCYQDASSFDVALYSQIQWNNIHGAFFHSSISGSNFVTHNSPFLLLLAPFYAIYPHPETLLVLKTLFLASSVIPFYMILKQLVDKSSVLPQVLSFLFFPFIVGQNFNAPHEMCFLPPLLLFSFYFYLTNRFKSFLVFLFLCLSVKEHMAMIAVMYGLHAIYSKRKKHWIMAPLVIGVVWGVFSMWIIAHFQKIYHVDPYPAWLIDNIERRLMRPHHSALSNLAWSLSTSNAGHWSNFAAFYLLFSPVCLFLPFFSSVWILGLPEIVINLLATIPLSYPTWHYDIVASIFLVLSCASAIRKMPAMLQELVSWFLCICVACHYFLWWDYTHFKKDSRYIADMNAAIQTVPLASSVSMTKHLVAYVSDRKDYFLCEDARKGQYIVLDKNENLKDCFKDIAQASPYAVIFNKDGIRVYKRS